MSISNARTAGSLVVEEPGTFRVSSDVYTQEDIFRSEMDSIFASTWVYLFHESQLPEVGSYRTTVMGTTPVIVSRGEDGEIRAFLNICRHRGSIVCRVDQGIANTFRCPYHGWIYANSGELVGVAQRTSGYDKDWAKAEDMGLRKVPRLETYRGLIFGSLNPSVPSLTDHLAQARHYVDLWADRSLTGTATVISPPHQYSYRSNWKLQMENGADGYHGNYVHESFFKMLQHFDGVPVDDTKAHREQGCTRSFDNGHCLLERPTNSRLLNPSTSKYVHDLFELHGEARGNEILKQRNMLIFPNLYLFDSSVRVIQPVSLNETTVVSSFFELGGVDRELNERRLDAYQRFFGTAGFGSPDDTEIFEAVRTGLNTGHNWMVLERGLGTETRDVTGEFVGHSTAETPQRAIYRQWARLMARTDVRSGGQGDGAVASGVVA